MLTETQKLETLTSLGVELNRVADLDILMERILTEARRFVNADAGSIYIRNGENLHFSYTQNATLQRRLPNGGKLIYSTYSIPIDENSIAGCAAYSKRMVNIEDAYEIQTDRPFHFSRKFDTKAGYRTKSMLTIPLLTSRGMVVGVLQIINAQDERGEITAFSLEDEKMMQHFASTAAVALERARMTRSMILRTIKMAEMRDPKETGAHVNRVAAYSVEIFENWALCNAMAQDEIEVKRDVFRMAAMLHDVGKVGISDAILKKPGKYTPDEFEIMKSHTIFGARLFDGQSEFDDAASDVALNHHERWDGTGYPGYVDAYTGEPIPGHTDDNGKPLGKKGEDIPIFGRIVAMADVYDALCSRRSYKDAWDEKDALSLMEKSTGTHFDPVLMEIFMNNINIIRSIRQRYPEESPAESEQPAKKQPVAPTEKPQTP